VIRHFEKNTRTRLFRRFSVQGSTLELALGAASEGTTHVSIRHRSGREAQRAADAWVRWALDAGFAEVTLEDGAVPGVVRWLDGPTGPGRIRTDEPADVFFAAGAAAEPLEVGERVVLDGIQKKRGLDVEWMFGSKLAARGVRPFPDPRWSRFRPRPDPPEKTRRKLAALAGDAVQGHTRRARPLGRVACGTLILAYEKGVHRLLAIAKGHEDDVVTYEPVLTSAWKRQSTQPLTCVAAFCEPVPEALRRELERTYGLG
jgi:hypothetical protein